MLLLLLLDTQPVAFVFSFGICVNDSFLFSHILWICRSGISVDRSAKRSLKTSWLLRQPL